MKPAGLELNAQPLAESALAAAGRAGDKNQPDRMLRIAVAPFYLLRNLDDLLFLKGFCNLDKVGRTALQDCLIHVTDIAEPHYVIPPAGFVEHSEGLGLLIERSEVLGMVPVRDT